MPTEPGTVRVLVPATSANLGPGFDALGLALGIHDEVTVTAGAPPGSLSVTVVGEGEDDLDCGESHLVVRALRTTLERLGAPPVGLTLTCRNELPHARGLGSSAAAIVAGVVAAGALAGDGRLTEQLALEIACELEGHADNVAACLFGGLAISWYGPDGPRATRVEPSPELAPVVFVPAGSRTSTKQSRAALPEVVTHADAARTAARAALLVHALTVRPDLLMPATEDVLHQPFRLPGMPATADLVARLRAAGVAAVLSGSGPTVLALAVGPAQAAVAAATPAPGFEARPVAVDAVGAHTVS